jgi:hypothetical protein
MVSANRAVMILVVKDQVTYTVPPVYAPAIELMLDNIAKPLSEDVSGTADDRLSRSAPGPPLALMKY